MIFQTFWIYIENIQKNFTMAAETQGPPTITPEQQAQVDKENQSKQGNFFINNPLVNKMATKSYMNDEYAFISYGGANLNGQFDQNQMLRGVDGVVSKTYGLRASYEEWSVPTTKAIIDWSKKLEGSFTKAQNVSETTPENQNNGPLSNRRKAYDVTGANAGTNQSNDTLKNELNGVGLFQYKEKDFVFLKDYGKFPNNRLITLRRFKLPVLDSGIIASKKKFKNALKQDDKYISSDSARALAYFGEGTGNDLNSILAFTTTLNWEPLTADVEKLSSDGGRTNIKPGSFMDLSFVANKIGLPTSGATYKLADALQQATNVQSFYKENGINSDEYLDTYQRYLAMDGDADPWSNQWKNRVYGPINVITSTQVRKRGLGFSQSGLKITFKFDTMQIDSLNPKIVMLDIISNMLALTYNNGAFWGGDYRFVSELPNFPLNTALSDILFKIGAGDTNNVQYNEVIDGFIKQYTDFKNILNDDTETIKTMFSGLQKIGENVAPELYASFKKAMESAEENMSNKWDTKNKTKGVTGSVQSATAEKNKGENTLSFLEKAKLLLSNDKIDQNTKNKIKSMAALVMGQGNQNDIKNNVLKIQPLLTGEPVGEWHLMIGNPMYPIAMIGNLICKSADFKFGKTLGPDDFPTELEVSVNLDHGRPRDKGDIESIFNLGQGRFYVTVDQGGVASIEPWNIGASTKNTENDNGGVVKSRAQFEASEKAKKEGAKEKESDRQTVTKAGDSVYQKNQNTDSKVDTASRYQNYGR